MQNYNENESRRPWGRVLGLVMAVVMLITLCIPVKALADNKQKSTDSASSGSSTESQMPSTLSGNTSPEVSDANYALPDTGTSQTETAAPSEVELKAETEDKLASVIVKGDTTSLPAGGYVTISRIEDEDKKKDVSDKLTTGQIDYEDFLAFDITIFDASGNKIEPDNSVTVSIQVDDSLLPKDVAADDFSITHLKEKDGEVTAESIKKDDTDVAFNDKGELGATFNTDSFSSFALIWKESKTYFNFTVYYVDDSGNNLTTNIDNQTISTDEQINFETDPSYNRDIAGYTYSSAHLNSYNGSTVTDVYSGDWYSYRYLDFYNDGYYVTEYTSSGKTVKGNIYLVYQIAVSIVDNYSTDGTFSVQVPSNITPSSYQWSRSNTLGGTYTNIAGATGATFNVAEDGDTVKYYKVTVTSSDGQVIKSSPQQGYQTKIGITNNSTTDGTFTAVLPAGVTALSYQWSSSSTTGGTYTNIAGATAQSYNVVENGGDSAKYYKVTVTASNNNKLSSDPLLQAQTKVTINDNYSTDGTFAAVIPAGLTASTYQWYSSSTITGTYTQIAGATGSTFNVLNDADSVKYYKVAVMSNGGHLFTSDPQQGYKIQIGITDNVAVDGTFSAVLPGGLTGASYQWYRCDTQNGTYTAVTGATAQTFNVVEDGGSRKYYYVAVTTSSGKTFTSSPLQVKYYTSIQDGSFENVLNTMYSNQYTNADYLAKGGMWQSTGIISDGRAIEILNPSKSRSTTQSSYNILTSEALPVPDGNQAAELNCETDGALYQDVLTVPNSQLFWSLYHRARGSTYDSTMNTKDTMYVIIMSAEDAQGMTQANVQSLLSLGGYSVTTSTGNSKTTVTYQGKTVSIWQITDPQKWVLHNDGYTVPNGQYLTRFFFASGKTASNNNTIGNFIDKVTFSAQKAYTIEYYVDGALVDSEGGTFDVNSENGTFKTATKLAATKAKYAPQDYAITSVTLNDTAADLSSTGLTLNKYRDNTLKYYFTKDFSKSIQLTLTKVWDDGGSALRPGDVTFVLTNNKTGVQTEATLDTSNATTPGGNTWKSTVSVPKYNADSSLAAYTLSEETVDGYDGTVNAGTYTVTNKLKSSGLTLTKTVSNDLTDAEFAALKSKLVFTVTSSDGTDSHTVYGASTTPNATVMLWNGRVGTVTVNAVAGKTYSVTESGADVFGYSLNTTYVNNVTAVAGQTKALSITNNYTKFYGSIRITKTITGAATAKDKDGNFQFEIKNINTGVCYYATVNGEGSDTVANLPAGKYSVRELSNNSYVYVSGNTTVFIGCKDQSGTLVNDFTATGSTCPYVDNANTNGFKSQDSAVNVKTLDGNGYATFVKKQKDGTIPEA